jgi:hypothetical protein
MKADLYARDILDWPLEIMDTSLTIRIDLTWGTNIIVIAAIYYKLFILESQWLIDFILPPQNI